MFGQIYIITGERAICWK